MSKGVAGYSLETREIQAKIASLPTDNPDRLVAGAKEAAQSLTKHTAELTGGIQTIRNLVPVLTVTTVEAYLKDVLIYAAGIDKTLMERSEQTASYQDICAAESLATVINELRGRWAQNFIDRGGPKVWIESLERMGASGSATAKKRRFSASLKCLMARWHASGAMKVSASW